MGTVPFMQPGQTGQTGMPGNTASTVAPNYGFMPGASPRSVGGGGGVMSPNISTMPYMANNFNQGGSLNPFGSYTGFNLGLNSADELTKMYGPLGTAMYYYLNQGAGYNPSVLGNLINQIQPQVARDTATIGSTAGMLGNRFGSAYEVGLGDYLSQVNQNELNMASGLYQHSQDQIMNAMQNILPGAGQFKSNQGGFTSSLLSSLLPLLAGPISGGITDLLNLIPGVNIPTGGGGGGSSIPGLGGIPGIGGRIGGGGGGGVTTTTPPTFPQNITWDQVSTIPTQTSAGQATAGDSQQGLTLSGTSDLDKLLQLMASAPPTMTSPTGDLGGGTSTGGGGGGGGDTGDYSIPYIY